jgi:predicted MFS family arabinose efflux permease
MDTRRMAVFLAGAAAFATLYAPQSLLPVLHPWLGGNAALAGLVISATTIGVALAAPFMGALSERAGRRRVIVTAAFAACVPTIGIAAAQDAAQMIAARFLEGLLLPGIFAVTVAYIADTWPAQDARSVTALYVAGTIFGGFFGRLTAGLVTEFAGWRLAFVVLTLMQLAYALAVFTWLPQEPRRTARTESHIDLPKLLMSAQMRGICLAGFAILFSLIAGFTYVSLMLARPPFSLGPAALSGIFTVYIVSGLATPIAGRLLNALGHRRLFALAWATTIGGLLLTLPASLPSVILGLCLFSGGLFFAQTTAMTFVGEAMPAARGPAVGVYVTSYYIGGSVGGVLPAPVWSRTGWPGVIALIAVAGTISVISAWRSFDIRRTPPREIGDAGTPVNPASQ